MSEVLDEGPFSHGTKADLREGDLLTAGFRSNYRPEVVMNHIYFTALRDGAGLAAELAAASPTDVDLLVADQYGVDTRWYLCREAAAFVADLSRHRQLV